MSRLIITADIHGLYSRWLSVKALLKQGDTLVVAGDLFDTRYGRRSDLDFQPEVIRDEFLSLTQQKFYVYGNCDHMDFFPGEDYVRKFNFGKIRVLVQHGHIPSPDLSCCDLVIEGHSHVKGLSRQAGVFFLNPGSASLPRDDSAGYGLVEGGRISLIDLETGKVIDTAHMGAGKLG